MQAYSQGQWVGHAAVGDVIIFIYMRQKRGGVGLGLGSRF